ncbi:MAG: hypothetical protein IJ761_02425 [Bacteroidales bacterium]|nr:hypothetical protein [Bacteroidales bacterium]
MRKFLYTAPTTIFFLLMQIPVIAQNASAKIDSAVAVIERFQRMMSLEGIASDSILLAQTTIVMTNPADTFVMRRWWATGGRLRIEVMHNDTLQTAYHSDGKTLYRKYYPRMHNWVDIGQTNFIEQTMPYELRGPLHNWQAQNARVDYRGMAEIEGLHFDMVHVELPDNFSRNYFFDITSGLLTLVMELNDVDGVAVADTIEHTRWKAYHEYMPIGESLLPSQESFLRGNTLHTQFTTYGIIPSSNDIFTDDQ